MIPQDVMIPDLCSWHRNANGPGKVGLRLGAAEVNKRSKEGVFSEPGEGEF